MHAHPTAHHPRQPYRERASRCCATFLALARPASAWLIAFCFVPCTLLAWASAQRPARYEIGLADGTRQEAQRITAWEPDRPSLRLDDQQWLGADRALRWIHDRHCLPSSPPQAWIETWTGDRLPGEVLRYVAGQESWPALPAHLVVQSVTPTRPPRQQRRATVRVRADCVRRIVWASDGTPAESGTARTRDGRRIPLRALRWNEQGVTLLVSDGRITLDYGELAELNLPAQSPWPALLGELGVLTPAADGPLVQMETSQNVIATTSWQRQRVMRPDDPTKSQFWLHGVQPAWSLDVLWLPGDDVVMRRLFAPQQLPLSRLSPTRVVQRSPLAGQGRPWQRNRNVQGGWLASGPGIFGWGFGVHAHNELHFELTPWVNGFTALVGLDRLAGSGGCVQARVLLQAGSTTTLFETPVIVGDARAYAMGALTLPDAPARRTLILQVDHAHDRRPPGADPLDIRDSTDWLDPLLQLDRRELRAKLTAQAISRISPWKGWQCRVPADSRLELRNVWDELAGTTGSFQLATTVEGTQPLSLRKQWRLDGASRELVVAASCPLRTNPPVRVDVRVQDQTLATFQVPLRDRANGQPVPQHIDLSSLDAAGGQPVEFEILQFPGPSAATVQWHAIEFR